MQVELTISFKLASPDHLGSDRMTAAIAAELGVSTTRIEIVSVKSTTSNEGSFATGTARLMPTLRSVALPPGVRVAGPIIHTSQAHPDE